MNEKKIQEDLRHDLTQPEIAAYGQQLAAAEKELANITAQETSAKARFKARKTDATDMIVALSESIGNGFEIRKTDCIIRFDDPAPMKCSYVRLDTGEIYNVRKMTEEENQMSLEFEHGGEEG